MREVIVNADDFGASHHTVEWTIKGFEQGSITSATMMAGMEASVEAIEYAKRHPEFSFGVHLYLVDENPICSPAEIPSMIDPRTGKLWSTKNFIIRNFAHLIKVDDLVREMKAQCRVFLEAGVEISHVDGHGHNHRLPQSIAALRILQRDLGLTRVRRCQDIVCGKEGLLSKLINKPMQRTLAKTGMRMTDHFAMNAGHCCDKDWFSNLLHTLPEGVTEIGIHPGVDEEWRRIDTEDCYLNCRRVALSEGIRLITYKDI